MANNWWKEPDMGVGVGSVEWCAAWRMWRAACSSLGAPAARAGDAWDQIADLSPSDSVWHSLRNCVAYQAGVWQNLVSAGAGVSDAAQPAAFQLGMVLRHSPSRLTVRLLPALLADHPHKQELTSYVLALLTDDEAAWCGSCGAGERAGGESPGEDGAGGPAPTRDLQLFGDCELAVLAASREEYDAHAKLVRAEYTKLTHRSYVELRLKVLTQLSQVPQLYHTPEFACLEAPARDNIEREICTLREHLPPPPVPSPLPSPASPAHTQHNGGEEEENEEEKEQEQEEEEEKKEQEQKQD